MKHTDWCQTCAPDPAVCRHTRREGTTCLDCNIAVVECPVCAPVTYAHCAGCHGLGWVDTYAARSVRVTLRR